MSAVLSTQAFLSQFYYFCVKEPVIKQKKLSVNLRFHIQKNQVESPENITQETNKKNARSIQQFKCLLVIYILGYFLGERLFLQYLM